MKFKCSLQLDIRRLSGKQFKVVADTVRSGVKNEHGFRATKGLTDSRLKVWPVIVRFATQSNRDNFEDVLTNVLHPQVLKSMALKYLKPANTVVAPVRMAVGQ